MSGAGGPCSDHATSNWSGCRSRVTYVTPRATRTALTATDSVAQREAGATASRTPSTPPLFPTDGVLEHAASAAAAMIPRARVRRSGTVNET